MADAKIHKPKGPAKPNQPLKIDLVKLYGDHTCLIIDDLPEMRGAIKRMLASQGLARIDTAPNATEALNLCHQRRYTLVICDYNLGRSQDGQQLLDTLRHLKLLRPTELFIMITGETQREMVLGAIESQPDDYITKPFTPAALCKRLDKTLIKHHVLLPIKREFAEKNYQKALAMCDKMIEANSRFAMDAKRLRGRILFLLGELHKARVHYESVIENGPAAWAMLGLAETLVELGAEEQAEAILRKVLAMDNRYVEAHDLLARIHKKRAEYEQAQSHTKEACELSPKSVPRHRQMAELCELTGDTEAGMASYRQAVRWGADSIHENGSDQINFARKTAEQAGLTAGKMSKDKGDYALRMLRRAREMNSGNDDVQLQASLVAANIKQTLKMPGADAAADEARTLFKDASNTSVDSNLDYVRVLQTAGEEEEAKEHLTAMAAEYGHKPEILAKIERLSPEPISSAARAKVARLTKTGIKSYQDRDYSSAMQTFKQALSLFPNHVGLNLNLVQVLLERNQGLLNTQEVQQITRSLERVRELSESDAQYDRAQALRAQFAAAKRVDNDDPDQAAS